MKGEIIPVHRKALLNALKTAAHLDPERLDEMLRAAQQSFVQMGWNTADDLWTFGPLLEIAGRMARQTDQVDVRLPELAKSLHARQVVSPERFGLDFDPDQSIGLSLLSLTARVDRLIERESFGQSPDWCRDWILNVVLESASHLYAELERTDAAASARADVGAEGKQMVLQAAIRESMNLLENAWRQEATDFDRQRRGGNLEALRHWLAESPCPENQALSRILENTGAGMDALIEHLETVRARVRVLQEQLRNGSLLDPGEAPRSPAGHGPQPGTVGPAPHTAEPSPTPASAPAAAPDSASVSTAPSTVATVAGRRHFGRRR